MSVFTLDRSWRKFKKEIRIKNSSSLTVSLFGKLLLGSFTYILTEYMNNIINDNFCNRLTHAFSAYRNSCEGESPKQL